MNKLFWKLYYKFYKPKNKIQIIKKWERLDYYDFKDLNMVLNIPFQKRKEYDE